MENLKNSQFNISGERCAVFERKKTAPGKPQFYLFSLDRKSYISSLYPSSKKGCFKFEKDGQGFILDSGSGEVSQTSDWKKSRRMMDREKEKNAV